MLGDRRFELWQDDLVLTKGELAREPGDERPEAELLEPGARRAGERLAAEGLEGTPAKQPEGGAEEVDRAAHPGPVAHRHEGLSLHEQALEPPGVDEVVRADESVAAADGLDAGGRAPEQAPEMGDVDLQHRDGPSGWLDPDLVDEVVPRDDVALSEGEQREDALLARSTERAAIEAVDAKGPEQADQQAIRRWLERDELPLPPIAPSTAHGHLPSTRRRSPILHERPAERRASPRRSGSARPTRQRARTRRGVAGTLPQSRPHRGHACRACSGVMARHGEHGRVATACGRAQSSGRSPTPL